MSEAWTHGTVEKFVGGMDGGLLMPHRLRCSFSSKHRAPVSDPSSHNFGGRAACNVRSDGTVECSRVVRHRRMARVYTHAREHVQQSLGQGPD